MMMRFLACAAAVLTMGSVSQVAHAQSSGTQTGYVQCVIHYGDRSEITEITPVTRISMPKPSGSTGKNIQFTLSASFRNYLLKQGKKFYQSACLEHDDPELLQERAKKWEALRGYGNREKREIDPEQFWPGFLDYVYSWHKPGNRSLTRGAYSYSVIGSSQPSAKKAPAAKSSAPPEPTETAKTADRSAPEVERSAAREAREAEWQAKVKAHQAAVDEHRRKVEAREAEIARQRAEHAVAQQKAKQALAGHETKMESFKRVLEDQQSRQRDYAAALAQNNRCRAGDQKACDDIRDGRLDTAPVRLADAGRASTDTEARRCVTEPVVSASKTFEGQTAAVVFNGCPTAVDVRICLLRTGGWNCGVAWGVKPQERWTHTSFETQGEIFWDARVAGSDRPLASPDGE